jgi:hypothetical protein
VPADQARRVSRLFEWSRPFSSERPETYIESTAPFAMELGYHMALVRDAAAAFDRALMPPPMN